jgi:hypothetical protein
MGQGRQSARARVGGAWRRWLVGAGAVIAVCVLAAFLDAVIPDDNGQIPSLHRVMREAKELTDCVLKAPLRQKVAVQLRTCERRVHRRRLRRLGEHVSAQADHADK